MREGPVLHSRPGSGFNAPRETSMNGSASYPRTKPPPSLNACWTSQGATANSKLNAFLWSRARRSVNVPSGHRCHFAIATTRSPCGSSPVAAGPTAKRCLYQHRDSCGDGARLVAAETTRPCPRPRPCRLDGMDDDLIYGPDHLSRCDRGRFWGQMSRDIGHFRSDPLIAATATAHGPGRGHPQRTPFRADRRPRVQPLLRRREPGRVR